VFRFFRAIFMVIALLAVVVTGAVMLLSSEIRRPAGSDDTPIEFVVATGETTTSIATRLGEQKLIRQPLLFLLLVRMQELDGKMQAGNYLLRQNMTMSEIMVALQQARIVKEVQITIIEGMRIEQIATVVGNAGLLNVDETTALDAFRDAERFRSGHVYLSDLPEGATLEGYLFPDTYRLNETATITDVVETLLTQFETQYATIERVVQVPGVNVHQIVTMASIIQREATRQDEMALISAVFWNRLKPENAGETGGGKIQSDPTVQYILGTRENWWPKLDNLTIEQINAAPGPYNTRVQNGLPPGPISAPGLAALRAAARPDATANYMYFVAACGEPGKHNFAASYAEFLVFEQEYLNCAQ
jgi:UPF0755 protein